MKQYYLAPTIETITLPTELLNTVSADGLTHGGTDYGNHEADARYDDSWDCDE